MACRYAPSKLAAVSAIALVIAGTAAADDDVAALRRRIEAQEARIQALERLLKIEKSDQAAEVAVRPVVFVSPDGIALKSQDASTQIRFHGEFTLDGRFYTHEVTPPGSGNTWIVRRARPIVEGTFGERFDFRFNPDFASGKTVIQDAYVSARFETWAVLTAGKFKQPFGLERLQFSADNRFLELGLPSDLVPNRDLGLQFSGTILGGKLGYQIGWFNGTSDGVSSDANVNPDVDNNDNKDLVGRIVSWPFLEAENAAYRGLTIGAAVSYVDQTGDAGGTLLPSYRTESQRTFFNYDGPRGVRAGAAVAGPTIASGKRLRWSPQAAWYVGSVGILGEYVRVSQGVGRTFTTPAGSVSRSAQLDHAAWQVYSTLLLTGESATFRTVIPDRPFTIGGPGWGAFEIAARFSRLTLDPATFAVPRGMAPDAWFADPTTQAHGLQAWTVGLNWYLTQNVGWMVNIGDTHFGGGVGIPGEPRDRSDESWLVTRFQVNY